MATKKVPSKKVAKKTPVKKSVKKSVDPKFRVKGKDNAATVTQSQIDAISKILGGKPFIVDIFVTEDFDNGVSVQHNFIVNGCDMDMVKSCLHGVVETLHDHGESTRDILKEVLKSMGNGGQVMIGL